MGATSKYGLPWPATTAFLKDGATAIKSLAEAVEAALLPPLLALSSTDEPDWTTADKAGRVAYDVSDAANMRGNWNNSGSNRFVIPPTPGWYMVATSFRFGGQASSDVYELRIQTKQQGADQSTAYTWIRDRREIPSQAADTYSQISTSTLVRVLDGYGIQVEVAYAGSTNPPATTVGSNKLRAFKVSAL